MTGVASAARQFLEAQARWHWAEALPWLAIAGALFLFPDYLALGTQIIIAIIFALSLDLILGYAGIITLGHAAYFGAGAYATGMISAHLGWGEPISAMLFGGLVGAILGFVSGWILLRYHGLTLLMLTLATAILMQEGANAAEEWTGGFDGLVGISIWPLFDTFEYDLWSKTYYCYAAGVLLLCFFGCAHYRAFGVRAVLGGYQGERGAYARHRHASAWTVGDHLYSFRGHGRFGGRPIRRVQCLCHFGCAEFRSLGHCVDYAGFGRCGTALWRCPWHRGLHDPGR